MKNKLNVLNGLSWVFEILIIMCWSENTIVNDEIKCNVLSGFLLSS